MEMKPVKSSNIVSVGYNKDTQTLAIEFKGGGTYHYAGVSPEKHEALMNAESIGKHFHAHIRQAHEVSKQ